MEFELSRHASEVIFEREIEILWIERTLENPGLVRVDSEDVDLEHRFKRIEESDNRILRVVVNKSAKPIRIVTVYFDRKMKGRL